MGGRAAGTDVRSNSCPVNGLVVFIWETWCRAMPQDRPVGVGKKNRAKSAIGLILGGMADQFEYFRSNVC
jgi:hypothetical protein